jgi:Transglycosylase-like domain
VPRFVLRARYIAALAAVLAAAAVLAGGAFGEDDQRTLEFHLPSKGQLAKWRKYRAMHSRLVLGVPRKQLESIAECESHGDPRSIGGGGLYRGKYQFDRGTWHGVGGEGDPVKASELEQDRRAAMLLKRSGGSPWPVCS